MLSSETILGVVVALPGVVFCLLALLWLLGASLRERFVVIVTAITYVCTFAGVVALFVDMSSNGLQQVLSSFGNWFTLREYEFPLVLKVDRVSLPFVALTTILTGLVGAFSARYMHREPGFLRFFLLLHLFAFGALVIFTAGTFDLLIAGWEFVGLTSVLLIAFFHERPDPVSNALRVFAVYRGCDIGLLVGVVVLHHYHDHVTPGAAALVSLLFLLAASGKSAQFPFSGWLPRAMEGPTPSSAIFYGAISVHAGAYLMLRTRPYLDEAPLVAVLVVALGLLTAVLATLASRACTDVKTSLAYASVTQVGVIFAEIGLGLETLALVHICGHAAVRTLQFLRAPSALHEFHQLHAAAGGHLAPTGSHYESMLSATLRSRLYRFALDRAHMDTLLDRFLVAPLLRLSTWLNRAEDLIGSKPAEPRVVRVPVAGD